MLARTPYHPVRDMPSCQWSSVGHRYDFHREESGFTVEACMDCGKQRKYPVGTNSKHCVPMGTVIEFPPSELDQLIGKESRL